MKAQHPAISVIVCTYNRCESLRDTLQALKRQAVSNGLTLEILVVDNNSTDRTKHVVEELTPAGPWPIRYVFEPRQGLSHARNRAIQEAGGVFLAFTDDDVLPASTWVQALLDAFITYEADCVGGKVLPLWLGQPPEWMQSEQLKKHLWGALALLDRGVKPIVAEKADPNFIYGANMAFRKMALDELGEFQADLGPKGTKQFRGDDSEMIARFLRAGKRAVYTPQAVVAHKVLPARMRVGYFRRWRFWSGRSRVLMRGATTPPIHRWLIRACLEHGLKAISAYAAGDRVGGLQRELPFWSCVGQLYQELSEASRRSWQQLRP